MDIYWLAFNYEETTLRVRKFVTRRVEYDSAFLLRDLMRHSGLEFRLTYCVRIRLLTTNIVTDSCVNYFTIQRPFRFKNNSVTDRKYDRGCVRP